MSYDNGGAAFPRPRIENPNGGVFDHGDDGMTIRIWLAGKALANHEMEDAGGTVESAEKELGLQKGDYNYKKHYPVLIARRALSWADAIIAQDKAEAEADYKDRQSKRSKKE